MSNGFSFGREGSTPSQLRNAGLTDDSRQFVFKTENSPGVFRSRVYTVASRTRVVNIGCFWLDGLFSGLGSHHGTLTCVNPLNGKIYFERYY